MIVAILGYFIFPLVTPHFPLISGKNIAELDALLIPNEKTIISNREILSQKAADVPETPSYLVCSIDDDPDGTNAYGIYDPTDLAVTVSNLIRLNTKHLFLGTHLHWPDLPEVENNTLNSQLELLESCILSVPLRRSADAADIPKFLLDSSIPLTEVNGNAFTLPKVNNISLAPTLKIPENCKVGFSQLESESETAGIPLLAIWDERVLLSSLLLERMHHLKLSPTDIVIHVGKFIALGRTGNVIPIDEYGYFSPTTFPEISKPHIISANITSVEKSPISTENAVLTASGIVADDYRAIESPVEKLTQLTLTPVFLEQVKYQRIWWWFELGVIVLFASWLSIAVRLSVFGYWLWVLVLLASLVFGSISLSILTTYYAPVSYLMFSLISCMIAFPFLKRRAIFIHEILDNQHDLGDLSILYKQEYFDQKELTPAQLAAKDRRQQRKPGRRDRFKNRQNKSDPSDPSL
jgi:hypothetical protein